jgi:hypothetical protein
MSIGILANYTHTHMNKYFSSKNLANALNAKLFPIGIKTIEKIDHLIIIGMRGLETYSKLNNKNFKSVAVIFSDTRFCIDYKWCNNYVIKNNIPVYAMPDLHNFLQCKYIPAYQTITCSNVIIEKPIDRVVICHSPGIKCSNNWKGTNQIGEIVNELSKEYKIEYKLLTGLSNEQCIKEKSSAHIFVDQLIKGNKFVDQKRFGGDILYNGGLGKSGIEGMCLKCCVITSMDEVETEPYFPFPPIVITDYDNFKDDLERIVCNIGYRNLFIEKQKKWVDRYCSPEFVAMNVLRHIL